MENATDVHSRERRQREVKATFEEVESAIGRRPPPEPRRHDRSQRPHREAPGRAQRVHDGQAVPGDPGRDGRCSAARRRRVVADRRDGEDRGVEGEIEELGEQLAERDWSRSPSPRSPSARPPSRPAGRAGTGSRDRGGADPREGDEGLRRGRRPARGRDHGGGDRGQQAAPGAEAPATCRCPTTSWSTCTAATAACSSARTAIGSSISRRPRPRPDRRGQAYPSRSRSSSSSPKW